MTISFKKLIRKLYPCQIRSQWIYHGESQVGVAILVALI